MEPSSDLAKYERFHGGYSSHPNLGSKSPKKTSHRAFEGEDLLTILCTIRAIFLYDITLAASTSKSFKF